jgi:hypothetical protein
VEVNDRCRKFDKVGETNEYVIAGWSSLSAFAYVGKHKQLAKTIPNTLPLSINCLIEIFRHPIYKEPEPLLESANMIFFLLGEVYRN